MRTFYSIFLTVLCVFVVNFVPPEFKEDLMFGLIILTLSVIRYEMYENNKNKKQ